MYSVPHQFFSLFVMHTIMDSQVPIQWVNITSFTYGHACIVPYLSNGSHQKLCPNHCNTFLFSDTHTKMFQAHLFLLPLFSGVIHFFKEPLLLLVDAHASLRLSQVDRARKDGYICICIQSTSVVYLSIHPFIHPCIY